MERERERDREGTQKGDGKRKGKGAEKWLCIRYEFLIQRETERGWTEGRRQREGGTLGVAGNG